VDHRADLLVAGAGPAGLATALHAAQAGLRVSVLDARLGGEGPLDKACGEGLMPPAVAELGALGVDLPGRPFRGIRYTDGRRSVSAAFRRGPGLGVRRTSLHSALLDAARAAGVELVAEHVREVVAGADEVLVETSAGARRASWLAAADGLHSPIRHRLGLDDGPPRGGAHRWGLRRHYAVRPWSDLVEVHWARDAEAYVTPVGDSLVGVAVLSGTRRGYEQHLAAFPALVERLPAEAETSARGAGPLRQRSRARTQGRVLLVGDAAGYVDALTGEGIAVALASARALVAGIVAGDPESYERRWLAASRRYRLLTSGLLWLRGRPALAPRVVPIASRLPRVFDAAVQQLAR